MGTVDRLARGTSQFSEQRVAERTPTINLNGSYDLSILRDEVQTEGSGTVVDNPAEFRVRHTGAGDFARLSSSNRGVYVPGVASEAGVGIRTDFLVDGLTGDAVAEWGYFDMVLSGGSNTTNVKDGLLFGVDSGGVYVRVVRNGSQQSKTYRENWNISPDVAPPLTDGALFQIDLGYHGYGLITFQQVIAEDGWGNQLVRNLHSIRPKEQTSLSNSNLQVGALVRGATSTDDFSVFVAGRQYSVTGKYRPPGRTNAACTTADITIPSGWGHILSIRRNSDFREVAVNLFAETVSATSAMWLQARVNADITGADWAPPAGQVAGETAIEESTAGSVDETTGVQVYQDVVPGGQPNIRDTSEIATAFANLPDEGTLSFLMQQANGTGTLEAFIARVTERW